MENDWSDSKYQQLNEIIVECNSSFNNALLELNNCLASLKNITKVVRDYEDINLIKSNSSIDVRLSNNSGRHIPVNNGMWSGEHGNSTWKPNNETILNDIRFYSDNRNEGIEYYNGYADFSPVQVYECKLPSQLYFRNNDYQFIDCTLELREHLLDHPDLRSFFDDEQLSAIENGNGQIPGYTWHHDVQTGRMQLIPTSIHSTCPHEGGQSIWGGGSSNR